MSISEEVRAPVEPTGLDVTDVVAGTSALVQLPTHAAASSSSRRRVPKSLGRLIGIVLFFGVWEAAALIGWLQPQDLAAPSVVFTTGAHMLANGQLESAVWASLQRVLWGLVIGVPAGVLLAVAAGLTRSGENLIDGNIQMLRFVPIIGLESLFILWLGVGETAKVAPIALGVMFPMYIQIFNAIRGLDPGYDELAAVVGLTRAQRIRRIVLPGVVPAFFMGLRFAVAIAWLLLVFVEQINATNGLGYLMIQAETFFQSSIIVVVLITYALLGIISEVVVRLVERRFLRWQPGR